MNCDFTSFSTVFQSYQDDDSESLCAMELRSRLGSFRLERDSYSGPLDQWARA